MKHCGTRKEILASLHHLPSLEETLERLHEAGRITGERVHYLKEHLAEWVADSRYILTNLGVHLTFGFIRFASLPPLVPIGTLLRPVWVEANRIFYTLKRDKHKKGIHSLSVLFFSAIPFLGYFAYTIPLKRKSEHLTYLYAQHLCYRLYDKTIEEKLANAPGFLKSIARVLIFPANS